MAQDRIIDLGELDKQPDVISSEERPRRSLSEWIGQKATATTLAIAALSGAGGAVIGITAERGSHHDTGISRQEAESIAKNEVQRALAARELADYYTDEIRQATGGKQRIHDMQFLNGAIHNSSDARSYRNLIILNLRSESGIITYDSDGAFLRDAYLGVAKTDEQGDLYISVLAYEAENSWFEPYDASNPVIAPDAYINGGKNGKALYTYDNVTQRTIVNFDGSMFSPVLIRGQ